MNRKKILFAKVFGIGNAVMAVPALKALGVLYPEALIDVLVGSTPDDVGAREVLSASGTWQVIREQHLRDEYDLAILSIPYDGRWREGVHFRAKRVMDGRTRPDPFTTGLVSWKKHEIEYQMDNVRELGYDGPVPDCSFGGIDTFRKRQRIYIGLGYKKDAAGFWKVKHWGNDNYAVLIRLILERYPHVEVVSSGDVGDIQLSWAPIHRAVADPRYRLVAACDMYESFRAVAESCLYVGNDTGMMHVAAAAASPVVGLFFLENSITKSHPWCEEWAALDGSKREIAPEVVMESIEEMTGLC